LEDGLAGQLSLPWWMARTEGVKERVILATRHGLAFSFTPECVGRGCTLAAGVKAVTPFTVLPAGVSALYFSVLPGQTG
jgi:hypothetical protein